MIGPGGFMAGPKPKKPVRWCWCGHEAREHKLNGRNSDGSPAWACWGYVSPTPAPSELVCDCEKSPTECMDAEQWDEEMRRYEEYERTRSAREGE